MTIITQAEPADIEALANLAEEMDRFYGATEVEPIETRRKQISRALFYDPPSAYVLLARNDSRLDGFASYSFLWPAVGLTTSLYLKELYVTEAARGQGIGKLLMCHLYEIAIRHNCSRVEWTTDQSNLDAQRFYTALGVGVMDSKLFYRVQGNELRRQARA